MELALGRGRAKLPRTRSEDVSINGISGGASGIQRQSAALDRAAEKLARAASRDVQDVPSTPRDAQALGVQEGAVVDGTVELLVAKRMFSAALKMAQVANEGIGEALRLGDYDAAA